MPDRDKPNDDADDTSPRAVVYDLDLHRALAAETTEIPPLRVLPGGALRLDAAPTPFRWVSAMDATPRPEHANFPPGPAYTDPMPPGLNCRCALPRRSWLLRLWFRVKLYIRRLLAWQRR